MFENLKDFINLYIDTDPTRVKYFLFIVGYFLIKTCSKNSYHQYIMWHSIS